MDKLSTAMSSLVKTALAQDKLAGLSDMLGVIVDAVDAQIAILWQGAPEPVNDRIFIVAGWFKEPPEKSHYFHAMPVDKHDTHTSYIIYFQRSKTLNAKNLRDSLNNNKINSETKAFLVYYSIELFF